MKHRWKYFGIACAFSVGALTVGSSAGAAPKPLGAGIYTFSVKIRTTATKDANFLSQHGFDLIESRSPNGGLMVMGDASTPAALAKAGYRAQLLQQIDDSAASITPKALFDGGYGDADQQYAHLTTVATNFPTLAKVVDYGDSWRKTQALGGHDLEAICITKLQPGDCALAPSTTKPRFLLMAQIHARELATGEVASRWIDDLTTKYGTDADITALLDSTEVWIVPVVNPDGVDIVKQGGNNPYLQRKNADNVAGPNCPNPPTVSSQAGVDLNRNAAFKWGGVGTSSNPCDQTYPGTGPGSEPEDAALMSLMTQLFPDQRGPLDTDAAPATSTGSVLSLHSYANDVLIPWSYTNTGTPNDAAMRAVGFRYSYYNGYKTGQTGKILYNTSGSTSDWAYASLGVASHEIEMGPSSGSCSGFTPAYSCVTSTFYPLNKPVFLYAAKLARQPFTLALGPNTRSVALSAGTVVHGTNTNLTAIADDAAYGNASGSVGRPATQKITAAEYCIDTAPWAGCTPTAMTASDGSFNSATETVKATIPTASLAAGRHTIYVRSKNLSGNFGPFSAIFLTVT